MSEVARHQSDSGFYYASGTRNGGGGNANAHAHAIADANFTENQSQTTTEIHDQTPDALLAYELNQLSFHERNTINEEVHGVHNSYPDETPQLLHDSLIQLEQEIQKIKHKPAFELAQEKYGILNSNTNSNTDSNLNTNNTNLNPNPTGKIGGGTYVNTDTFRLIFLRCEIFNTKKAAVRIIAFLELSYEFCGEFSLYRTILLSDFDSKGLKLLKTGVVQILPGRDRSGRRVMGNFSGDFNPKQHELHDRMKIPLYMFMQVVKDDIDAQRKGAAYVFWSHNIRINDFRTRRLIHQRILQAIPVRLNAAHCCLPCEIHSGSNKGNSGSNGGSGSSSSSNRQVVISMIQSFFTYALGPTLRSRLRIHTGSATECLYILQTFGIQSHQMPINTNTGKIKLTSHHKYIELHIMKESIVLSKKSAQSNKHGTSTNCTTTKNTENNGKEQREQGQELLTAYEFAGIECPQHTDILFGRGWVIVNHPGNAVFRNLMESKLDSYDNADTKREKTLIAWSIVYELRDEHRSRFLREDKTTGWWFEVTNETARQKVSIGFRDIRKARLANKSQQLQQVQQSQQKQVNNSSGDREGGGTSTKRKYSDGNNNNNNNNTDNNTSREFDDVFDDDLPYSVNHHTVNNISREFDDVFDDDMPFSVNYHTVNHDHNNIAQRGNVDSVSILPFDNMLEEHNAYAFLNMDVTCKKQRCNHMQCLW